MWIKEVFLVLLGLCAGGVTAAGIFSFIAMVGVVTRLSTRTGTANRIQLYEDAVTVGSTLGNLYYFWPVELIFGRGILVLYGVSAGIFIGCLAVALAEVLNVIPVFSRRIQLKQGLSWIVCAMAFGKIIGSLYQLVWIGK